MSTQPPFHHYPVIIITGKQSIILMDKARLKVDLQYLALRPEVNVNVRANARIELGSILAFVVRLH